MPILFETCVDNGFIFVLFNYEIAKPQAVSDGDGKLSDTGNNRADLN
jgi:hypothetical protein